MNSGLLIAGLTFVLVMLAGILAFYYSNLYKAKRDIRERLRKESSPEHNEVSPGERNLSALLLRMISRFGEAVKPKGDANVSKTRKTLLRAGYYGENDPVVLFGTKAVM